MNLLKWLSSSWYSFNVKIINMLRFEQNNKKCRFQNALAFFK